MRMASALGRTGNRLAFAGRREDCGIRGELAPDRDGERPKDPAPFLSADEAVVLEGEGDRWCCSSDPEHERDDELLEQHLDPPSLHPHCDPHTRVSIAACHDVAHGVQLSADGDVGTQAHPPAAEWQVIVAAEERVDLRTVAGEPCTASVE